MPPRGWKKVVETVSIVAVTDCGAFVQWYVTSGPTKRYRKVCAAAYSLVSLVS
jgi:hypothetical protein